MPNNKNQLPDLTKRLTGALDHALRMREVICKARGADHTFDHTWKEWNALLNEAKETTLYNETQLPMEVFDAVQRVLGVNRVAPEVLARKIRLLKYGMTRPPIAETDLQVRGDQFGYLVEPRPKLSPLVHFYCLDDGIAHHVMSFDIHWIADLYLIAQSLKERPVR